MGEISALETGAPSGCPGRRLDARHFASGGVGEGRSPGFLPGISNAVPEGGSELSESYESFASYRLKRGVILRKLTLRGKNGATRHFRIGKEMAANASYILRAKEVGMR